MENKRKHLELIQNVITRMANNSFMLKGWAVTLISGIFILSEQDTDKMYFLVAYIPIIFFWGLDSYYLLQERLYLSLYDNIMQIDEDEIDFSLKATVQEFNTEKNNFRNCFSSNTELWFYLPVALVCTGVIIITHI